MDADLILQGRLRSWTARIKPSGKYCKVLNILEKRLPCIFDCCQGLHTPSQKCPGLSWKTQCWDGMQWWHVAKGPCWLRGAGNVRTLKGHLSLAVAADYGMPHALGNGGLAVASSPTVLPWEVVSLHPGSGSAGLAYAAGLALESYISPACDSIVQTAFQAGVTSGQYLSQAPSAPAR